MNKLKKLILNYKWLIFIFIGFFCFYWFELRPVLIKKECSWTTYTTAPIPAFAGITQEQADEMNKKKCSLDPLSNISNYFSCGKVEPELPRPAEQPRKVKRNATQDEYQSCIRHHGL